MKKLSIIILSVLLCIMTLSVSSVSYAAGSRAGGSDSSVYNIVLGVGANETERNIAYFSTSSAKGEIRYTAAANLLGGIFPQEYSVAYTTSRFAANVEGAYAKAATIRGLAESTKYAYVIVENGVMSDVYYFETSGYGDFEFVFVGDPQIGQQIHGEQWQDTLKTILNSDEFAGAELLISAGDQIVTPDDEELYSYFIVDELTDIALAPTVGPSHDAYSQSFSDHFNLPNLSDKYGVNKEGEETSANYWYTYNNTLFMHLNMSDTSAATNGEHEAFMKEAMAANPNVMWNIVIMHSSLYSTGDHGNPEYQYYDSEIGKYRPTLSPVFTELGIDVVFSGHDHVYVRSKLMNGIEVSGDTVVSNSVFDPEGTLYVCASSSTGSKFYQKQTNAIDQFIAFENYEERKSAIKVKITGESLTLTSYFLDDMEVFDIFIIQKVPHVCAPEYVAGWEPTCILSGQKGYYYCECGTAYEDAGATKTIFNLVSYRFIPALQHDYATATCTAPKTCIRCGEPATTGKPLGHKYDAVCDAECNRCGELREAVEHRDGDNNGVCDRCLAAVGSMQGNKGNYVSDFIWQQLGRIFNILQTVMNGAMITTVCVVGACLTGVAAVIVAVGIVIFIVIKKRRR